MLVSAAICLWLTATTGQAHSYRADYPLPSQLIPDGWGVNIHFTHPAPGEMDKLAETGFKWVRMDFFWNQIEKSKGRYDFADYDVLIAELEKRKIRAVFILDYGNDLYEKGAPKQPESRAAFCRFTKAAVAHFKGKGILWEMYNEPNIAFWLPKPNVKEYIALATEVGKSIRATAPDEWYVGPAVSAYDSAFLEACFKAGLLKYWDAVSWHPYRSEEPETVLADHFRLRETIQQYAPKGKAIPILSGEWGYSDADPSIGKERQAQYVTRQYLANLMAGVPISIWYDWKDDGTDPKEREHHFGTHAVDLSAKPASSAVKELVANLSGYRYNKRIYAGKPTTYRLLFTKGASSRVVEYTSVRGGDGSLSEKPSLSHEVVPAVVSRWAPLPDRSTIFAPADLTRLLLPLLNSQPKDSALTLSMANSANPKAKLWSVSIPASSQKRLAALIEDAPVLVSRSESAYSLVATMKFAGKAIVSQAVQLYSGAPMRATLFRVEPTRAALFLDSVTVAGTAIGFDGRALIYEDGKLATEVQVHVDPGLRAFFTQIPLAAGESAELSCILVRADGKTVFETPPVKQIRLDTSQLANWDIQSSGDPTVKSTQTIDLVATPSRLPFLPSWSLKVDYSFGKGWKFIELRPRKTPKIPGKATSISMWVFGDESGNQLRMRFKDSTGQVLQPTLGPVNWKGWRLVSMPLNGTGAGHWGGANDGVVHHPISIESAFLLDATGESREGSIWITGIDIAYEDAAGK